MPEKDQPPERIWLDDEALAEHFARVKASYSTQAAGHEEAASPLDQNELTRGLTRG